jgi:EAL domain-containing protein (putative c-di-GMP-specific phosphodiesterase class I)
MVRIAGRRDSPVLCRYGTVSGQGGPAGKHRFFTDGMDAEVRRRVSMNTELRDAIASEQFFLMYQPQVDTDTGRIVGRRPWCVGSTRRREFFGPDRFIPEAEKNGLIVPLGRWVIHEAYRQTRLWLDAGIAPPLVAIDLSAIQFRMPLELECDIAEATRDAGLRSRIVEFELTETVLMAASQDHNEVILRLRKAGHRIAIDDFGSGYSSLEYLRR